MRAFAHAAALGALLACGCAVYHPALAPPGRFLPETGPGVREAGFGVTLARDGAAGVDVDAAGQRRPVADPGAQWLGADLALRWGFTERFAAEGRVTLSFMNLVFPVPAGLSLAPIWKFAEPRPGLGLFTSPRFVCANGELSAAGDYRIWRTLGLELPVTAAWTPARWFGASGTLFVRGLRTSASRGEKKEAQGPAASWLAPGVGLALDLAFTLSALRLGAGLAWELAPNPGASLCPTSVVDCARVPELLGIVQGGVSLSLAWR